MNMDNLHGNIVCKKCCGNEIGDQLPFAHQYSRVNKNDVIRSGLLNKKWLKINATVI